ncbi:MAG: 4Fe-4S dicluster domain-containing protein [Candidatus Omnitrophica bacterium]|nr:4Fe-4S dicluster domain-containing protein [Candidatus Omnitrophota bacterium]
MAKIIIDKERCKGCSLCISVCPKRLIALSQGFNSKGYHFVRTSEQQNCVGCLFCAIICPDTAIEVYK